MPSSRRRADLVLVDRGYFESRAKAQAAIAAGRVTADGAPVARASDGIFPDATIEAAPAHPYVSRGGVKLVHALDRFDIDVSGVRALDVGASTGGFSDALLQRGAAHVTAVDVGRGQLHPKIASDPRVTSLEGIDIRTLGGSAIPAPPSLVVIDVSFAPLGAVLAPAVALAADAMTLVALIKPQFEVGRAKIGKGGIVKDEAARMAAVEGAKALVVGLGLNVVGVVPSPIAGGDGNVEYLIVARRAGASAKAARRLRPPPPCGEGEGGGGSGWSAVVARRAASPSSRRSEPPPPPTPPRKGEGRKWRRRQSPIGGAPHG